MAKKKIKEDVSDDIGKAKALKRKTRKVLKNPEKAGEVADELSKGSVDAPEKKEEPAKVDPVDDTEVADGGDAGVTADASGDEDDAADGMDDNAEETPDLGTFLERAIANSKDAIAKYEKHLAELKEKVKSMGLEVPGLLDPDDVSDEQTPEEFPPDIEAPGEDGAGAEGDAGADANGEGGDEPPPPPEMDGGEGGEGGEGGAESQPADDGADAGADSGNVEGGSGESSPKPTKEVESSIAAPAPTNGTKLR